jgi:HEAT repeat protein
VSATPPAATGSKLPALLVGALVVATLVAVSLRGLPGGQPSVGRLVGELAGHETRTAAYQQLLERGPDAVEALLEVAKDPQAPARADAIELLGRIRDARAVPAVLAVDDPELAHVRLTALGRLRGPEAQAAVLAALAGADEPLHFPALISLIEWPDPDGALARVATPFLKSPHPGLREAAALFCGKHVLGDRTDDLIGLLKDVDGTVRQAAARALLQIGSEAATAAVDSAIEAGGVIPDEN